MFSKAPWCIVAYFNVLSLILMVDLSIIYHYNNTYYKKKNTIQYLEWNLATFASKKGYNCKENKL